VKRGITVFLQAFRHGVTRPLFWSLVVLVALLSWGLSGGHVTISSGDASVGGTKAWITSEFAFSFALTTILLLVYGFFVSIGCGLAVVEDDELRIAELLHATPLTPRQYVWGKFTALLAVFLTALGIHLLFAIFCNHVLPSAEAAEIRGPFQLLNYLRPVLVFGLPTLMFIAGGSFYLGERTRRPLLVALFPLALLLVCGFFLWEWSPTWLDPRINRVLMLIDPSGFRWLNETWLRLDRGAKFYNTARVGLDAGFVISRFVFFGLGLLGVALAERSVGRRLRGVEGAAGAGAKRAARRAAAGAAELKAAADAGGIEPLLAGLRMRSRAPGLWQGSVPVMRAEARNLFTSPGIYLFGALILLQTIGSSLSALGPFDTELLLTPGTLAVRTLGYLSALLCLLLMFYTVESVERDRSTGLAAIANATPTSTASLLLGKGLANGLLAAAIIGLTYLACVIALLVQGTVAPSPGPFLLVWGLLLVPTILVWTGFVIAVQALFANRTVTYGVCLAVLSFTMYRVLTQTINWVGNWPLWGDLRWTDMGTFEIDRRALVLSRVMALGLAAGFIAIAVRAFRRREPDAMGTLHRLAPRELARAVWRFSPYALVPLVAGSILWLGVFDGYEGGALRKKAKDYWKQNLGTWREAPIPAVKSVDLDVTLDPEHHSFHNRGTYELWNDHAAPLARFAVTSGLHWRQVSWTMNGKPYKPENRSGLFVIVPPAPLPYGGRVQIGFDCSGAVPEGFSKNGDGDREFILPSGVVLTTFTPSFTPLLGYQDDIGIEKENRYEPRVYPPDFYLGRTDAAFGSDTPFTTRIRVTAPAAYTINSVGVLASDTVAAGRRTAVWVSDQPVRFFNIVAGRWQVKRGAGTAIYYHPGHPYNVARMSGALDAARRYYSQWFYPYPWQELKISEFPALASYAQGFPTDITFSEGIGFLTEHDIKGDLVFLVTAHESAHQWWGNLITPGKGPGGDLLSEGMAHFSTLLLIEQARGLAARIEFAKRIEERYGRNRRPDAEHPLVEIDGSRNGDTTVTYDKGGWVFWMLLNQLGRDRDLAGLRKFIADWKDSSDHPVLQDFVAAMRPFAADPAAYDAFVHQWFFTVVVPEYQLRNAQRRQLAVPSVGSTGAAGSVGAAGSAGAAGAVNAVGAGAAGPGAAAWEVSVLVRNIGTGRMPVEVAAARGDRFTADGKPDPGYRDSRTTVTLGAGEERRVTLRCRFEPQRVLVDPDALVLQLDRKGAIARL
jgi:ABC-2 type transport system permease protein